MTQDTIQQSSDFEQILQDLDKAVQRLADFRNEYLGQIVDNYDLLNESKESWIENYQVGYIIEQVRRLNQTKHKAMQRKFETTIGSLKQSEALFAHSSAVEKARFCYLNGKALNTIQPEVYTDSEVSESDTTDLLAQATQWLTRALKFNPQLADAWCELGDTCWRQGEPVEAANHFRQALKIDPSHIESMCQLSMILRQLSPAKNTTSNLDDPNSQSNQLNKTETEPPNRLSPLQESLQLAHDAVKHRPTDGHAWSVLGNALITLFFTNYGSVAPPPSTTNSVGTAKEQVGSEQANGDNVSSGGGSSSSAKSSSRLIMSRCLAAYAQASKDRFTALEPNFHYNRGLAWHYQDLFANSLRCWLRSICLDPEWPAPRICVLRLVRFLIELDRMIKQFTLEPDSSHESDDLTVKRQRQVIEDWIGPLAPCMLLLPDKAKPVDGQTTDVPQEDKKPLTKKESAAIGRLLGPYYRQSPGGGDSSSALWSDAQSSKKGKKRGRSGRINHAIASLPFFQKLQFTLFSNLEIGPNNDRVCCGRVVGELPSDSDLTLNLILLDAQGTPLTVRLFNIGKGLGPVKKDIIAIPHPFVEEILVEGPLLRSAIMALSSSSSDNVTELVTKLTSLQLAQDHQPVSDPAQSDSMVVPHLSDLRLRLIRIPLPDVLVVNGHSVGSSWTAAPVLKNIFFTT